VHCFTPELLQIALKLAKRYQIPLRNCNTEIERYEEVQKVYAGVATTDFIAESFYGEEGVTLQQLEVILDEISESPYEVFELCCHPAFIDPDLLKWSSYAMERVTEVETLTSSKAKEMMKERNLLLTNFTYFG
jgi:predicted glycoside hydrolase/deacetylase ChbG (UPF0249 family)